MQLRILNGSIDLSMLRLTALIFCVLSYALVFLVVVAGGYVLDFLYPNYLCVKDAELAAFVRNWRGPGRHTGARPEQSFLHVSLYHHSVYFYYLFIPGLATALALFRVFRAKVVFGSLSSPYTWAVVCFTAAVLSPFIIDSLAASVWNGISDKLVDYSINVHEPILRAACDREE